MLLAETCLGNAGLITALALMGGSMVILTDPIFQGMAISLFFGVLIATLLTLIVIPMGCDSWAQIVCDDEDCLPDEVLSKKTTSEYPVDLEEKRAAPESATTRQALKAEAPKASQTSEKSAGLSEKSTIEPDIVERPVKAEPEKTQTADTEKPKAKAKAKTKEEKPEKTATKRPSRRPAAKKVSKKTAKKKVSKKKVAKKKTTKKSAAMSMTTAKTVRKRKGIRLK